MGKLLSVLSKDNPPSVDLFVDFEGSQPGESEAAVYSLVQADLQEAEQIIKELQQYVGASNEIREAISNPKSEEHQEKAWNALCPLVLKLKHYYEFSINLENMVPQLLQVLCSNDMTPREHLETQQALFKQFAEILDFVLTFDDLKMTNPAIQNDFSYYRRTLSRKKMANEDMKEAEFDVSNEVANRMSLFYAEATPMLKTLSKATTKFVTENKDLPIQYTTDILGTMASVCREMIQNEKLRKKMEKEETEMFCLRVMVGVIILYDHVHHTGAFNKASVIDMKSSVKVLKEYPNARVEGLLNALRYNTIHLNDETTPKNIKALLS